MKSMIVAVLVVLAECSVAGCRQIDLASREKDRDIRVDGSVADWNGIEFVEKEDLSIALSNDDSCLYVAVIARDQLVRRQIMKSGLYLWFDESGGKNKVFGVCFPVGGVEDVGSAMRPRGPRRPANERGPDSSGAMPRGGPPGGMGGAPRPGDTGGSGRMGGPGGEGGEEPKRPEAIKVWGKLTLAGRANR